jgi:hypothetical protein
VDDSLHDQTQVSNVLKRRVLNPVRVAGAFCRREPRSLVSKICGVRRWSSVRLAWYPIDAGLSNTNIEALKSELCRDCGQSSAVLQLTKVFVLAHSDGQYLKLSGRERDSEDFTTMLDNGRDENHAALLVLNCCLSAIGGEQSSLLSAVARKGFCGLIGTEAEILNTHALRCGIHLMWGLCALGKTLGDAFADMQRADDLFPLNLFYTCYADRGFGLREPLRGLAAA